jgi:hypothetical protein
MGGEWSTPGPGRFTPGNDPVPIVQEAVWAPGPVWTGAENVAPTGIFFLSPLIHCVPLNLSVLLHVTYIRGV